VVCRGRGISWTCSNCEAEQSKAPSATLMGLLCDACIDLGITGGEPFIPLTVKMMDSKATADERPIIAVSLAERRVILEGGEVFPLDELPRRLMDREHGGANKFEDPPLASAIVVCDQGVDLLAWLDGSAVAEDPFWQWQVAMTEKSAWRPEARSKSPRTFLEPKARRFGFASRVGGHRRAHGRARWFQVLDVHQFVELPGGWGEQTSSDLLKFGFELREWCNRVKVPVGSSASAVGARLLRDSRFGEGWRRKVPAATNARARMMLPGNHYQLLAPTGKQFEQVHKWDMARAHHWAALTTRFPHPDRLDARGWFRHAPTDQQVCGPIRRGSPEWREMVTQPGMFVGRLTVPEQASLDPLALPILRKAGSRWATFSSAELAEALEAGATLGDIWASWVSPDVDERLNEYSCWAQEELQRSGAPRWLKPALLSAYGLLAARPRAHRAAWRWVHKTDGGVGWQTSEGYLSGLEIEKGKVSEPQTVNVIWRVLIERAVRQEALRFARSVRDHGGRPLAVYADAIFAIVRDGEPSMRIPPPWRYEGVIHNLEFEGPSRYRSREETRLPGTPRKREGMMRVTT
jgi:hypothetical protein